MIKISMKTYCDWSRKKQQAACTNYQPCCVDFETCPPAAIFNLIQLLGGQTNLWSVKLNFTVTDSTSEKPAILKENAYFAKSCLLFYIVRSKA